MEVWLTFIGTIIVALMSFLGVCITNKKSNTDMLHKFDVAQAVTNERIDELTREVRIHNNFAQRVPVLENEVNHIKSKLKEDKK